MNPEKDVLIAKALSKEASERELADLREWFLKDKMNERIYKLQLLHHLSYPVGLNPSINRINQKVVEQIKKGAKIDGSLNSTLPLAPIIQRNWLKVAAIFVAIIGLTWFIHTTINVEDTSNTNDILVEKVSPKGRKMTVTLSDGSVVKLNSSSSIQYLPNFKQNTREVFLKGEAFFEVARNEHKPFIVHSGRLQTVVLGTSFNINAHPEQDKYMVSVVSGRVLVRSHSDSNVTNPPQLILESNEMASYSKAANDLERGRFDLVEMTGWKDGLLVLKNANLDQIREQLEEWYGVNIVYLNTRYEDVEISATFDNETLKHVLESLSQTLKFNYTVKDKEVKIKFLNP